MSPLNNLPGSRSPSVTDAPPERRPDRPARFGRSR